MPRDPDGIYVMPANAANPAVPLTPINSAAFNALMDDLEAALGYTPQLNDWSQKTPPDGEVVGDTDTQTLTNKTIDASVNAISNLETADFAPDVIDADTALTANSDTRLATQKAVKTYADSIASGSKWKDSVVVATTVAGTLATSFANGQTVNGVVLATGNRFLIKNQAAGAENGLYTVNASGAPTRAVDGDTGAELVGAIIPVMGGSVNPNTLWACTSQSITLGVTAVTFTMIPGGTAYTAGTGLTLTGNTFALNGTTPIPNAAITNDGVRRMLESAAGVVSYVKRSDSVKFMSDFADNTGAYPTISAALKRALLECHRDGATLDLEGKMWALNAPVEITNADLLEGTWVSFDGRRISVRNGQIAGSAVGIFGTGDYLLKLIGAGNNRIHHPIFHNVQFIGNHLGDAPEDEVAKTPVRFVATSGALATDFENGDSYDGLTLATGNRFLYQPVSGLTPTLTATAGIYVVQASGAAVRATDADTLAEINYASVAVTSGTYAGSVWWLQQELEAPGDVLGTTELSFRVHARNGLYITTYYHFILSECAFYNFTGHCVFEEEGAGFLSLACRYQPQSATDVRRATCVESHSSDLMFIGGWFDWALVGINAWKGSQHFVGAHWSMGNSADGMMVTAANFHRPNKIYIQGACDIDNSIFHFYDDDPGGYGPVGAFQEINISGCEFQGDESMGSELAYIVLHPPAASYLMRGVHVLNNTFEYTGAATGKKPLDIDTSSGTIDKAEANYDFIFEANYGVEGMLGKTGPINHPSLLVGGLARTTTGSDSNEWTFNYAGSGFPIATGNPTVPTANGWGVKIAANRFAHQVQAATVDAANVLTLYRDRTVKFNVTAGGAVTGVSWGVISDRDTKTAIKPATSQLEDVLFLASRLKQFERIDSPGKEELGLIAQDIMRRCPELVTKDSDSGLRSIAQSAIVYKLLGAFGEFVEEMRGQWEKSPPAQS